MKREQGFYLFLMISAYASTLIFGTFYWNAGIPEIYQPTYGAFVLFVIYGTLSFFSVNLVILFRLSIITASAAFFSQIYFTGGIESSAITEFVIPPLLAFFYKPIRDRYYFMALSGVAIIAMYILTLTGHTQNLLPDEYVTTHGMYCTIFVFAIVCIYTFLFRNALVVKNKKLGESMRQLQDATQKLIESEKMASLGMLSAGVAHEINNPLNFIKGGIEVLEDGLKNENLNFESEPCIYAVKEGLNRATTIVNSLNHFSRNNELTNEECDVKEIIENCLVMLRPKLKYKAKVRTEFDSNPCIIIGNEGKLHQAFLNFLSNAEYAIDERGEILIRTKKERDKVVIEISDNGVGIPKEHLRKISDPFFTTKEVGKGTGLGLSISYKIIESHNGRVSVDSKEGEGTKFTISFNQH